MYYVYVLFSYKDKKLYYGFTSNLKRRVEQHNLGLSKSTKGRRPLKLIYWENYLLREDAELREKYLKTSMGGRVIKKQLTTILGKLLKNRIA